jgi:ABC-type transport system involved in multi-copper enzyme maturation permease subunit
VLGVDARAAWGRPIGALVIPILAVASILVGSASLLALVTIAERPTVRLRDALRACLYLAVRRWYLTFGSLAVLGLLETLLANRPAIALGLAAAPLLYVVWANSRFTLNPALGPVPGLVVSAG